MQSIRDTHFQFPGQQGIYNGKVRDVYFVKDKLVSIASDRISAFDHILPKPIPCKGQVLNQIAAYFLAATKDICPNWLEATPDPNVSVGIKCDPIRLEMVVRGYLAGHAAREYKAGKRILCGVVLPEGMKENDKFPTPIITPATKAEEGHDEDISKEEILKRNIVSPETWATLEKYALGLFARGTEMALKQGLILVDTKYEFGIHNNEVYLIDEIHTPDSSRYFYAEGYADRQAKGEPQQQLSKEFVREWLMEQGFQGKDNQQMPFMPDEFVNVITARYIELYERVTGKTFVPANTDNITQRIEDNVKQYFATLA
ncbi:MAG: phosphoribosylaminoimidazolesuccinocarboxamide synthase [Chitinophagales bacterium]|nr:phosphoribosylaminoimidazolesuccinocarboxamide synthase [Chitinophagales bacterium]